MTTIPEHPPAVVCSRAPGAGLAPAARATGVPEPGLPRGAGHDAVALAEIAQVAMLFVRCEGGISHHPDESLDVADVPVAIDVATRFRSGVNEELGR